MGIEPQPRIHAGKGRGINELAARKHGRDQLAIQDQQRWIVTQHLPPSPRRRPNAVARSRSIWPELASERHGECPKRDLTSARICHVPTRGSEAAMRPSVALPTGGSRDGYSDWGRTREGRGETYMDIVRPASAPGVPSSLLFGFKAVASRDGALSGFGDGQLISAATCRGTVLAGR